MATEIYLISGKGVPVRQSASEVEDLLNQALSGGKAAKFTLSSYEKPVYIRPDTVSHWYEIEYSAASS